SEIVHKNLENLIKGLRKLGVPIIWVEQYPEGLGHTVEEVSDLLKDSYEPIAKMNFSACGKDRVQELMKKYNCENYIIAGVEAHVCVYQTVCDLLAEGKHVEFVQDAISSRTLENKQLAINKMSQLGAYPTSVEMVLFELLQTAEHEKFREISAIIK